jgi:hypothetical protein
MKRIPPTRFVAAAATLLASCNLINPAEPLPGYLQVEPFTVQASAAYGSGSNRITDVYVVVDNVSLGAYSLPALFPVLETGYRRVTLSPGIMVNGISNLRGLYPFYESYSVDVLLEPGQRLRLDPVVQYGDATVSWLEDFENAGFSLEATSSSQAPLTGFPAGDPAIYEGGNSGRVELASPATVFDLVTTGDFVLKTNTYIFLEIDYRCNNAFGIGVSGNFGSTTQRRAVVIVNPKETWNKLYVDLSAGVASAPNAINYKVYLAGERDPAVTAAYFYFDNLKLLHD